MILSIIGIIILGYLILAFVMYRIQESFIFYPTRLPQNYEFKYFKNFEESFIDIDKDTRLHALHFRVEKPKGVILYFHGNARSVDDWAYVATDFTQHQYDFLIPDYRTYGKSTGQLSEQALHNDALLWYKQLLEEYDDNEIIIFGRSLGTGIATELASTQHPRMLILETPYLSLPKLASEQMPFLPVSLLMKYHLNNENKIKNINCPVHIFHGTDDTLIPVQHAQQLAEIHSSSAILTIVEDAGHNNLLEFEFYRKKLKELLR